VAQLIGKQLIELCLVLRERCFSECLDRLVERRVVDAFGLGGRAEQQACRAERKRAGGGQITTAELHRFLPRSRSDWTQAHQTANSEGSQLVRGLMSVIVHAAAG